MNTRHVSDGASPQCPTSMSTRCTSNDPWSGRRRSDRPLRLRPQLPARRCCPGAAIRLAVVTPSRIDLTERIDDAVLPRVVHVLEAARARVPGIRESRERAAHVGQRQPRPGGGSAGRGPVLVLGPGVGTTWPPEPAVVNAPMFDHGPTASDISARTRHTYRLAALRAGSTVNRTMPDASTAPVPLVTMVAKSLSLTWNRYDRPAITGHITALAADGGQLGRQTDIGLFKQRHQRNRRRHFQVGTVRVQGGTGFRHGAGLHGRAHSALARHRGGGAHHNRDFPQLNSIHVSSIYMGRFILARVSAVRAPSMLSAAPVSAVRARLRWPRNPISRKP